MQKSALVILILADADLVLLLLKASEKSDKSAVEHLYWWEKDQSQLCHNSPSLGFLIKHFILLSFLVVSFPRPNWRCESPTPSVSSVLEVTVPAR